MMNCEKHINKIITNSVLFFGLIVFTGCSKETRKDDYLARVNESYLTREELASLVDTSKRNPEQKDQIIKNWVYNEMLFQTAVKKGITSNDNYKRIIKNSDRQLAAAMLLEDFATSKSVDFSEEDLHEYYLKNKNYFKPNNNSYLINRVYFSDENEAVKFRELAILNGWDNTVNMFLEDSAFHNGIKMQLVDENSIYPLQLSQIIKDIYPQEISIVITEKPGYYSLVQMLNSFSKDSILPFDVIKTVIQKRFVAEKKNQIIEDYLKELYSQNEIEIKK